MGKEVSLKCTDVLLFDLSLLCAESVICLYCIGEAAVLSESTAYQFHKPCP